jgi:TRAP-type C4-dicarboxylate transport system permease small subunit
MTEMPPLFPAAPPGTGAELLIDRLLRRYCRLLEWLMAACLLAMVVLVFGNVVLRYVFNTGLTISEEMSRWLFVWLTFLGGIVGLRAHAHLGTEVLVGRLGVFGKKLCFVTGYGLMFVVCGLLFRGSWAQVVINWDVSAPSSGASMAWFYAVGLVFSVSCAAVLAADLYKLLTGRMSDADLIAVKESEEQK